MRHLLAIPWTRSQIATRQKLEIPPQPNSQPPGRFGIHPAAHSPAHRTQDNIAHAENRTRAAAADLEFDGECLAGLEGSVALFDVLNPAESRA